MKKHTLVPFLSFAVVVAGTSVSFASVNMLKVYRDVNPELKADCTYCHLDKLPKKDEGKHELNPYGMKIKEMVEAQKAGMTDAQLKELYASVFKQLGRHDTFKADTETGK